MRPPQISGNETQILQAGSHIADVLIVAINFLLSASKLAFELSNTHLAFT